MTRGAWGTWGKKGERREHSTEQHTYKRIVCHCHRGRGSVCAKKSKTGGEPMDRRGSRDKVQETQAPSTDPLRWWNYSRGGGNKPGREGSETISKKASQFSESPHRATRPGRDHKKKPQGKEDKSRAPPLRVP